MIEIPRYMQIYHDYVSKIQSGRFNPGDKLPGEMEIALQYNVSRITSRRAMELLQSVGYVDRTPGRGTYVNDISINGQKNRSETSACSYQNRIGLIAPSFSDNFAMELLIGVEQAAREHGYHLMLRQSKSENEDETLAIRTFHESGCVGLILMPQHNVFYNDYLLRLILDQYPVIIVDRQMKGLNTSFITSDNYTATFNMTQRMLDFGHQHIAFLSNPLQCASTLQERYAGFREAFISRKTFWNDNLLPDFSANDKTYPDAISKHARNESIIIDFIYDHPEVTCLFATEYSFSQLAYSAVKKMGLSVPKDMSIVGYDGPSDGFGNPVLTRILQPQAEMGMQSVSMLDRVIKKVTGSITQVLPSGYIDGGSLAEARKQPLDMPETKEAT